MPDRETPKPTRAFAAVQHRKRSIFIDRASVRYNAQQVRDRYARDPGGWPEAMKRGWRVEPVLIFREKDLDDA